MIGDDGLPIGPFSSPEPDLPWPPPGWPGSVAGGVPSADVFPAGPPVPPLDLSAAPVPELAGPIAPDGLSQPPLAPPDLGVPPPVATAPAPGIEIPPPPPEFGSPFAPGATAPAPSPEQGPGILSRIGSEVERRAQPLIDAAGREVSYQGTARQLNANPFNESGNDIRGDLNPQETQRYFNELYTRNPVKAQELESTLRTRREQYIAARQQQIQKDDIDAQRRAIANYQSAQTAVAKRRAAIDADADRLAQAKIDPMAGISGGQTIAGLVAAIAGGLTQGARGGENAGLNGWLGIINQNIERQRANIANQREGLSMKQNALAREVADHGDTYRAAEAMRLATLKQVDDQLAATQLNFSPRGTTFMRIAKDRAQIAASLADQRQKSDQKAFEDSLKLNDAYRQERTIAETERNNRAQNYLRAKEIEETALNRGEARASRLDAKTAKAEADKQKLILERSIGGEVTPVKDAQGNVVGRTLGPITTSKGDVWIPTGTEPQVTKLQDEHAATLKYLGTIDEIRRLGPEYLSDVGNSEKLQRLKQLAGTARLQAIAMNGLGVPTGHDIELADTFVGTSDPTKLRSSLAGLMQGRETAVRNHNKALARAGLDKYWNPPDLGGTTPVDISSAENTALKRKGSGNPEDLFRDELARQGSNLGVPRAPSGELLWSQVPGAAEQAQAAARAAVDDYKATGITPAQRSGVDKLRAQAEGGDASALATLTDLAANARADSKAMRRLAQEALNRVEMARRGGEPGPSTDVQVPTGAFSAPAQPTFPGGQ